MQCFVKILNLMFPSARFSSCDLLPIRRTKLVTVFLSYLRRLS